MSNLYGSVADLEDTYNTFVYKRNNRGRLLRPLPDRVVSASLRLPYGDDVTPLKRGKSYRSWSHYGQVFSQYAHYSSGSRLFYDNEGVAVAVVSGSKITRFYGDSKYFRQLAPGWRLYAFPDGYTEERYAETGYGPVFDERSWRPAGTIIFRDHFGRVTGEKQGNRTLFYYIEDPSRYDQVGEEERVYHFDEIQKGLVVSRLLNKAYLPNFVR